MSAKEKAAELVRKYYTWGIKKEGQTLSWIEAKQCALITIDEIIKQNVNTMTDYGASWTYWQQIKTEIEKL